MRSNTKIAGNESGRRPIRLLFVQTQSIAAGAQEISRILAEELARYTCDGAPEFEIHHLFFYRITDAFDHLDNVHFCLDHSPRDPVTFARFLWRMLRTMRAIGPDVVLTFQHYGNIFGAPAARLSGARRIIANHVSAPATIGRAAREIDRILGTLGFYDVITVNSRETLRDYQSYAQAYARRLVYVPHGFEDKSADIPKDEARAEFGLPAGVPMIGSVARLHPLKQLDAAVATLPGLPGVHLALVGIGPDEQRLRDMAQTAGVADRLHFVGELAPRRVGHFLACLDAFVFPSQAETFGLAPVEAGQAGVPVISNDLPVLREVLQVDGEPCAVFVDVTDTQAFTQAIANVLADRELAGRLSACGRRLSSLYSVGAMADAYRRLILDGNRTGLPAALPAAT